MARTSSPRNDKEPMMFKNTASYYMWVAFLLLVNVSLVALMTQDVASVLDLGIDSPTRLSLLQFTGNYQQQEIENEGIDKIITGTKMKQPKITLVVSFCKTDLNGLSEFFRHYTVHNVIIVSKCGYDWADHANVPPGLTVVHLPNKGRCDHSYMWAITELYDDLVAQQHEDEDHVIFFMKDNIGSFHIFTGIKARPLSTMVSVAQTVGFSCLYEPAHDESIFHETKSFREFFMDEYIAPSTTTQEQFKSPHKNLGHFADVMSIPLPKTLTPVCYSGSFAVHASRIIRNHPKQVYQVLEKALNRADNLEEGHFMERLWAAVFTDNMFESEAEAERLLQSATALGRPYRPGLLLFEQGLKDVKKNNENYLMDALACGEGQPNRLRRSSALLGIHRIGRRQLK